VRALLPSLSLSVECLCLCFDFGLDSILYLIIYCPACAKKKEGKKSGDSQKTKREKDMDMSCAQRDALEPKDMRDSRLRVLRGQWQHLRIEHLLLLW